MEKETIIKFWGNRCTGTELTEFIQWAEKNALDEEILDFAYNDWKTFYVGDNLENDKKFRDLFDKIQQRIDNKAPANKVATPRQINLRQVTAWLTRSAAILLLPVLAFLFYTLATKDIKTEVYANLTDSLEIIAPIGSRTIVQLSDGTEVHLNYGSSIKYPQKFSGDMREVSLSGEGFFEVAHNPKQPFIVKTAKLNIKALGTSFNVMAYPEKDEIEATLVNGKVALEKNDTDGKTIAIGSMLPGQHVSYNTSTGDVYFSKGDIEKYLAWKDGKLIFEDTPIAQVAEKLSRMFNVDIEVSDDIKDYMYTVTLIDDPLFQILDLMSIATPIQYTALPRKKLPDGTFLKQKIIIYKDLK